MDDERGLILLNAILLRAGHIMMSQRTAAKWVGGMARLERLIRQGRITQFEKTNKDAQNGTVRYCAAEILRNTLITNFKS